MRQTRMYLLGLLRQLARGRQDQRLRVGRGRVEHLQDAHGEHRRFSGSRLAVGTTSKPIDVSRKISTVDISRRYQFTVDINRTWRCEKQSRRWQSWRVKK